MSCSMLNRSTIVSCLLKLVLLLAVLAYADALKCYQGQQSGLSPLNGSATDCPFPALSCLKQEDQNSRLVVRSCQAANCTFNGQMSATASCQNTTSYPIQQWCCCYTEGCNSAPGLLKSLGWPAQIVLASATILFGMSRVKSIF